LNVREATAEELSGWDAEVVDVPGGNVLQSRAWAEHRRRAGWSPRFVVSDDGGRVLTLVRRWPILGGGSAYLPRGPVGGQPEQLAERQVAISEFLGRDGVDVVAADPEVPAADVAFGRRVREAGFRPIEEIQPSRHRLTLPLASRTEEEIFAEIHKSTRQRIHKAEDEPLTIVRHDRRSGEGQPAGEFTAPSEPTGLALDHFYDLLLETGERKQFTFGPRNAFVGWWRSAWEAGHLIYLEALGSPEVPVAGLILYRHGGRLSTVHSGDTAEAREAFPGALHLLRWRAIQLAIREGCAEMDLGGADLPGARREPVEGDAMYGLYQHKRSFGATWLELTGAHERVFDARGYAVGRLTARLARLIGR
jgi:lipid II:glycine glycyltransferase (peptidoglycan interpeptide bridge formation enzyme)